MEEDKLKYKEILCKTMKSFINICKEHNLQYYACAGTCLGAIRHKGMIPWDDDIDVLMQGVTMISFLRLNRNCREPGMKSLILIINFTISGSLNSRMQIQL